VKLIHSRWSTLPGFIASLPRFLQPDQLFYFKRENRVKVVKKSIGVNNRTDILSTFAMIFLEMRGMNKLILFMVLPAALILHSCLRKNDPGIMCTQEYRILTISVKDQASNPVLLDQYFVVKSSTGRND